MLYEVITGHAACGKTTLMEALLVASGALVTAGSVERGDTVGDFDPMEKSLGHTLNCSVAHLEWAGHCVITSYSIHYTKLYERLGAGQGAGLVRQRVGLSYNFV